MADNPRSWSDLPLDLATVVLRRLPPCHLDRVRFGAVCPQWRAAARDNPALPPNFPWLALPDRSFYSLPGSAFGPLPVHLDGHRQLPHVQSSCGEWLVFERRDGALTLMSPFSRATVVLPGLHTLPDCRNKQGSFKMAYQVQGPPMSKLVVCTHNLVAAAVKTEPAAIGLALALCRPGAATWSWATEPGLNFIRDIVLFQGQLYAVSLGGGLSSVTVEDVAGAPTVSRVEHVVESICRRLQPRALPPLYLLESGGNLLMIKAQAELRGAAEAATTTTKFVVYVAMFEHSRWLPLSNKRNLRMAVPDNVVLFVGPWCSRSVAIPEDPQQKMSYIVVGGRSIVFFFSDDPDDDNHGKRVPFYCSVYDIGTGRSQPLLQTSVRPLEGFPATWVFPTVGPA